MDKTLVSYLHTTGTDPLLDVGPEVLDVMCCATSDGVWYWTHRRPLAEGESIAGGEVVQTPPTS